MQLLLSREQPPWVKIHVNVEEWRLLGDPTFRMHFRMSKTVFQELQNVIGRYLFDNGRLKRIRISLDVCLMMALWIIMNGDTFKNTALHFNSSPGVVHYHYLYTIEALRELAPQYIYWPSQEERAVNKRAFFESSGYRNVVGVIDGMHSYITAPLEDKPAYYNRHDRYSILSQVVVDHNMIIRDIHVGEPGSMHDTRVLRRSPLYVKLLEDANFMGPNEHILGDGSYPLMEKMIIPYEDYGHLNEVQRHQNEILSKCRSIVERSFCEVKAKFPRLKYVRSKRVEYAVDHIVSTYVLHKFIRSHGEDIDVFVDHYPAHQPQLQEVPYEEPPAVDDEADGGDVDPDHPLLLEATLLRDEKRERLAASLWERRAL